MTGCGVMYLCRMLTFLSLVKFNMYCNSKKVDFMVIIINKPIVIVESF